MQWKRSELPITQMGDQLYLVSIKECCAVLDFMKIHPMTTLLGGTGKALSSCVHCSDEMSVAMNQYFTNEGKLDIEAYRLQVEELKKKKHKQAS